MKKFRAIANLLGLTAGVVGGVLLAYSLSLKTSSYRLVETGKHEVVICHGDKLVVAGYGGGLVASNESCPDGTGPSEAAVIETNNDTLAKWGLILVILGFALQLPTAVNDVIR